MRKRWASILSLLLFLCGAVPALGMPGAIRGLADEQPGLAFVLEESASNILVEGKPYPFKEVEVGKQARIWVNKQNLRWGNGLSQEQIDEYPIMQPELAAAGIRVGHKATVHFKDIRLLPDGKELYIAATAVNPGNQAALEVWLEDDATTGPQFTAYFAISEPKTPDPDPDPDSKPTPNPAPKPTPDPNPDLNPEPDPKPGTDGEAQQKMTVSTNAGSGLIGPQLFPETGGTAVLSGAAQAFALPVRATGGLPENINDNPSTGIVAGSRQ